MDGALRIILPEAGGETTDAPSPAPPGGVIDLHDEARYFARGHLWPTILGVALGASFVVIGAYELDLLGLHTLGATAVVAALLVVLGISLATLTIRADMSNPVVSLRLDEEGLAFSRRRGGTVGMAWSDPRFEVEVQDLAPDPGVGVEERDHLFFTTPLRVYGSFGRANLGPVLDAAQLHGLSVRIWTERVKLGRGTHKVRRVRIGRPPS